MCGEKIFLDMDIKKNYIACERLIAGCIIYFIALASTKKWPCLLGKKIVCPR